MFLKLFKYDFIIIMKKMLFFYIPILAFSLFVGVIYISLINSENALLVIVVALLRGMLNIIIEVSSIVALILCMVRYYRTMLSDEGYLTHTIPVRKSVLLLEKLFSCFVVEIITSIVVVFSTLLSYMFSITNLTEGFQDIIAFFNNSTPSLICAVILALILVILLTVWQLSRMAFCFTLGGISSKNKVPLAILYYVGLTIFTTIMYVIIIIVGLSCISEIPVISSNIINWILLGVDIYVLIVITLYYLINLFILKKKLNLQ